MPLKQEYRQCQKYIQNIEQTSGDKCVAENIYFACEDVYSGAANNSKIFYQIGKCLKVSHKLLEKKIDSNTVVQDIYKCMDKTRDSTYTQWFVDITPFEWCLRKKL